MTETGAAIYEEVKPSAQKPYWWQANDDAKRNTYERCLEAADAKEQDQTRWRDNPAWEAQVRSAWDECEHEEDTTAGYLGLPLRLMHPLLQDMGLIDNPLAHVSTREKQAYAALCLKCYCTNRIEHQSVDDLVDHMLGLLVATDLVEWERRGARLELSGRGDPMPEKLLESLGEDTEDDFHRLVEYAVEVGISDMYGADTDDPLHYVMHCVWILHHAAIKPPKIPTWFGQDLKPGWGAATTRDRLKGLQASIDR